MSAHPIFDFSAAELAQLRSLPRDHAVCEAAAARDGVLSLRQLLAIGLSRSAIVRRVERRLLHPRHRGVFAVGRADLTRRGEVRAALLRCGRRAVLSHATAAWLLDLLGARSRIDVTVAGRPRPLESRSPIALHLTGRWLPHEVVWVHGFPCTSVARTLADLAGQADKRPFSRAWNSADRQLLLDVGALGVEIVRQRAGAPILRARIEHYTAAAPTESVLEELFLDLCAAFAIPPPVCQWPLEAEDRQGRVDFVWPDRGVALEVDGRRWHAIQAAHDRDRQKDLELREAGFDPHRYTYWQVVGQAARVARIVLAALERRSARPLAREAGQTSSAA